MQDDPSGAAFAIPRGKTEETLRKLESMVKRSPGSAELCAMMCNVYLVLGRTEIPRKMLARAIEHDPLLSRTVIIRSTALYEQGDFEGSDKLLESLVHVDPQNGEAWNDLGAVRFALGDWTGAEKAFRRTLELIPGYGEAILNLTSLYRVLNKPDLAVRSATMPLKQEEDTKELYMELAALIKEFAPREAKELRRMAMSRGRRVIPDEAPAAKKC